MTAYMTDKKLSAEYYQYPKSLLSMDISDTAKLVYMLLLDRARLSQKNRMLDENGHVFIYYPNKDLADVLGKSETTVKTSMRELTDVDLIKKIKQGQGKASIIYVKLPGHDQTSRKTSACGTEYCPSDGQKTVSHAGRFPPTSKNDSVKGINKTNYERGKYSL